MRAPIPTGSRDVSVLRLSCYAFVLRLRATSSCYAFLLLRVPMPIHPHFRDLAVLRLAEHRAARVDPRAGAAAAVGAAEFRGEPGARRVDLARLEGHIRLVRGDVLPVGPDGVAPHALLAERGLEEHGVGGEHGQDRIHVPVPPPLAKRLQESTIRGVHGAQYSPIWNPRSARMVHGRRPPVVPPPEELL